ncbi:MAG: hypothetical protein MUC92_11770 [Fimbriimonadaceae bacterium]|jgi:hypothetical protein|nr:hypothetical protein [Fimbriimonadaceae bacterium]
MNEKQIQVNRLADGDLTESESSELKAELTNDPNLASELEWAQCLKQQLKEKCHTVGCQQTWQASLLRLDAIDKTKRAEYFVGKYAWAVCGVFLVALVSAAVLNRMNPTRHLTETQVAGLFNSFRAEGGSATRGTVVDPFPGGPPLTFQSFYRVSSAENGFADGHEAVRFRVDDGRGGFAVIYVSKASGVEGFSGTNAFRLGLINGQRSVTVRHGEGLLMVMGDRGFDELQEEILRLINR